MPTSKVWRPERDERWGPNAMARKERHAVRHLNRHVDRIDRQRNAYVRREAGRLADGGSSWHRRMAYGYNGAYGNRHYGYGYGAYRPRGYHVGHHYPHYGGYGAGYGRYNHNPYYSSGYGYPRSYSYGARPALRSYSRTMSYYPSYYPSSYYTPRYAGGAYPARSLSVAPRAGRMYYEDSSGTMARRHQINEAMHDVHRAREELRDVRVARQTEQAVEMAEHQRAEHDRRNYSRQMMLEGLEVDRERRELKREMRQDHIDELRSVAAIERSQNHLRAPTPIMRPASAPLIRQPMTPMLDRPMTPYSRPGTPHSHIGAITPYGGSRPGTPYLDGAMTPYGSRPGTPFDGASVNGGAMVPFRPVSPAASNYSLAASARGSGGMLALPAPRATSAGYYGLGAASPGRSMRDFRDDETVMDELASELRQTNMMTGRRSAMGMRY